MADFIRTISSDKGDVKWSVLNTKDLIPPEIASILTSVTQINNALETFWLVQKAEMYLADAEKVTTSAIAALSLVKAIYQSLLGFVESLADTGFHELILPPEKGGLDGYLTRLRIHLNDATDYNRPIDDGNAFYATVMLLVSYKNMDRANEAFDNIKNIWGKFKTEGEKLSKDLYATITGNKLAEHSAAEPNGYWRYYYRKRLASSRKRVNEDGWYKQSLLDIFPDQATDYFLNLMESWSKVADGVPASSDMIARTQAIYDQIFAILKEIAVILDAYSKLFTDNQITCLVLPPIHGEAILAGNTAYKFNKDIFDMLKSPNVNYSGKKTANEQLQEYLMTLPSLIKDGAKQIEKEGTNINWGNNTQLETLGKITKDNPLGATTPKENFSNFLREDYQVGGVSIIFKGASTTLVQAQLNTFLGMFGLSL